MSRASLADAIYPRLPILLQNAACTLYGYREARVRYGPTFRKRLAELLESDWWDSETIRRFQDRAVADLVRHVHERVPYYRERMRAAGVRPEDVRSRAELVRLPILTKEDVRANRRALVAEGISESALIARHTGGTTGKSLDFYSTSASIAFQWAVWWRHRHRFGIDPSVWRVNFTGKPVVPRTQRRPPWWRWNLAMREAIVPMQRISRATARDLASFLDRHAFPMYVGYPSIVHDFVMAALETGATVSRPPAVIDTGAENLLDDQKRDFRAFFGLDTVLTDQYGFSEGCGNASQCAAGVYHEDFEFGVVEGVDGVPAGEGRTRARIVCTGFACPEFPFIRYDTGDVGVWEHPDRPCPCGRKSAVLVRIEGRADDYVITPEGNRIMRFDYVFKDTPRIGECQVVQDRAGEVVLKVVRREGFGSADEQHVRDEIARWISPTLGVRFEYVEGIEREANGKFRAVKSLIRG